MNIITKIEVGKRNKERVNVYIDDEFAFSLSAELIYKEKIEVKQVIDVDKLKKLSEEDNYIKCKTSALRIIERTYKTEKEMIKKLIEKGYERKTIDKTLEFLKEYNFLNDNNYVRMYVKDRSRNQGNNKIKYSLIQKGVSQELIEEELSTLDRDLMKETAVEMAKKKLNTIKKRESDEYKLWQKLLRFLVSKGYDYELASEVVKEVIKTEEMY